MKNNAKISFLKVLAELDKVANIRKELLLNLEEKLKNIESEKKEKIILDIVRGFEENLSFLKEIINLKNFQIEEILQKINNRISNNSNEIQKIIKEHILLTKILINKENLKENTSKEYITEFMNIIVKLNNSKQIYNYWISPTHQNFENSIQKVIFSDKNVVDLFFLHILNLYLLLDKKNFNSYINQIQNNLKIIIASYIIVYRRT